jgi:hypothetical protein
LDELKLHVVLDSETLGWVHTVNTLRTGDADLRSYIATVQDG